MLTTEEIRNRTVELLKANADGLKKEDIIKAIHGDSPETSEGTISTQVNMTALMFPDKVRRPRRGFYVYSE